MEQTLGLYLHIPFCKSKCAYCDFYSLPHSEEKMDAYAAALLRHLEEVAPRCTAHTVDTVYFGGGTPSYLGEKRLTHLLKAVKKRFHVAANAEITLEANPDSAGDWKALRTLRKAGFNRISLGVQAADDDLLRRIGRVHTWEQALSAAAAAPTAPTRAMRMAWPSASAFNPASEAIPQPVCCGMEGREPCRSTNPNEARAACSSSKRQGSWRRTPSRAA